MKLRLLQIFLLLISYTASSQSLQDLVNEANNLYKKVKPVLVFDSNNTKARFSFPFSIDTSTIVNTHTIRLKELESKQYKQDIGLVFKANANLNFRNVFDEEVNTFNRFRASAELEWNILKNGYIFNKNKSQQKLNEINTLILQKNQLNKQLWRRQLRLNYKYIVNKEKLRLFNAFLDFENLYFDFLNKLYVQKLITKEKLIETSNQIYVLQNQLNVLQKENSALKNKVSKQAKLFKELPFFAIKLDSIGIYNQYANTKYLEENISLEHKAINDYHLSLYASQNINYSLIGFQYFPAFGIRFKMPIRNNQRQNIIQTKITLLKAKQFDKSVGLYNKFITQASSYNEKLKDVQNQYKNWQITNERIRVLSVLKREIDDHNTGLLILNLIEEQFKILENSISLKEQLFTNIVHLFELHPTSNIEELITPFNFQKRKTKKQIVFTNSTSYTIDFQYAFIKAKGNLVINVLEKDISIQRYLESKGVQFSKINHSKFPTVEEAIKQELIKVNYYEKI